MTTIKSRRRENFAQLVKAAGGNAPAARALDVERNQVWQWLLPEDNRHHRGISDETADKITDTFNRPRGWLDQVNRNEVREQGPIYQVLPIHAYSIKTDEDPPDDGDVQIDVADIDLAAGDNRSVPEFVETLYRHTFRAEFLRRVGVRDTSNVKRCRVVGDSMQPMLFHGDMVTVDRGNREVVDVGVYAIVVAGQIKVKRLIRQRDGSLIIRSENPAYPDEIVPVDELDDVFIIGRVIEKSGRGGLGF